MILHVLIYNLIMAGVDVAVLVRLRQRRTLAAWLAGMAVAGVVAAAGLAIVAVRGSPFALMQLAAYGVFLHGGVLLAGSAVLFWRSRRWLGVLCGAAAVVLAAVAVDAFLVEPTWLEVSHYRFATSKLSETVRIVVLADLQTDRVGPYERRAFQEVVDQRPDLILLAGDYLHADSGEFERLRGELNSLLRELELRAPLGVYAVGGNIDRPGWLAIFEGLPVTAVARTTTFRAGELDLTCLDLAESGFPSLNVPRPDPDRYHVVVGHRPDFALGRVEADLLLAGHTHGGQVRLPLLGPVLTLSGVPRSWAAGLTELGGGRRLIVSRGIGHERGSAPRLRFLCRPELLVIDLVPEER